MEIAKIHLQHWLEYASLRGISCQVHEDDLSSSTDKESSETISDIHYYDVLRAIAAELNDELVGIKAGQCLTLKLLGLIYQISLQCRTIEEGLHYLGTYLQTTFPIVAMETTIKGKRIRIVLSMQHKEERINRILLESLLTIIWREITLMAAEDGNFILTSPFYHNEYPDGWRKGKEYSISLEQVLLKAAIRDRNDQHLDTLIPQYLQLIESYRKAPAFSGKVKATMLSLADPALPDINGVARTLYTTPRSLQRKLKEEQKSFRQLTEELKKEIADYLLRHEGYSVNSMAHILGYADASSLIHCFKRWFGQSPKRMRESKGPTRLPDSAMELPAGKALH